MIALILAVALCALPAAAGEYAVLSTGFRIHADRHETAGGVVRLFTAAGTIELPAASIVAFEAEDYVAPEPAPQPPREEPSTPAALIDEAAERYGLPREFLQSVAAVESDYRPDAVSEKGAIGVMQLMPGTARELNADPHDPAQNIDAGARLLRNLLLKYDGGVYHALAAYNAGAGAVEKYNGIPPYRETQLYVEKVVRRYKRLAAKKP